MDGNIVCVGERGRGGICADNTSYVQKKFIWAIHNPSRVGCINLIHTYPRYFKYRPTKIKATPYNRRDLAGLYNTGVTIIMLCYVKLCHAMSWKLLDK
jgi:hypothetical protein